MRLKGGGSLLRAAKLKKWCVYVCGKGGGGG